MNYWEWDSISLNTPAWSVFNVDEGIGLPQKRGSNTLVPLTDGTRYNPKKYDERIILLPMFVFPKDPITGVNGGITQLQANIDYLVKVFGKRGQKVLKRTLADASERTAIAEIYNSISFGKNENGYVPFAVEFLLSDPFFYGSTKITETTSVSASPTTWTHENPGTAHATKMEITFTGPLENPKLTNNDNTIWLQYNGTIAAGDSVIISTSNFSCEAEGASVIGAFRHGGDPMWMLLYPGDNSLKCETDTAGGSVTIEYYAPYF